MRIGIDARLTAYRIGGIAEYTRQLVAALVPLALNDQLVLLQHWRDREPLSRAANTRRLPLFTPPHHRLEAWSLPVELLPYGLDLLHCPDFIAPRLRPCRAVVTIHDLAFLHFPAILDAQARRYYGQVRASAHAADAVIAVSQSTRTDICTLLELPPERVNLVYEAAAPLFRRVALPPNAQRSVNGQQLYAGEFVLFVSTIEPRKNIPTLLRALHLCRQRQPRRPYLLALAGKRGWHDDEVFTLIRDLGLSAAVRHLGGCTLDELLWLYNACRIYVNPSRYEGFGLPVVEALACGAPTIVSDTSSLPEVAGDAALRVPPFDVGAWADSIELLWDDADRRAMLSARGPIQAAQFSWARAARETLAIYEAVKRRT